MNQSAKAILVLLLVGLAHCDLTLSSFNGEFSSFNKQGGEIPLSQLVTVANYYGCKTWSKDQCLECSKGYFFNKNGVCCEVSPLCSQFNVAEGVCQACYQGYSIVDGACKVSSIDTGCIQWKGNACIQCSKRWFFDTNGHCQAVSDQCATWESSGNCLTCYGGYVLSKGACVVNPNPFDGSSNVLCAVWKGTSCIKCAERAFFNIDGLCVPVDSQCQTWDPLNGNCLSCYGGYLLSTDGRCTQSPVQAPSDAGCSRWSADIKTCLECSQRFFFDTNGKCQ